MEGPDMHAPNQVSYAEDDFSYSPNYFVIFPS